jgi:hypothetical protein
VPGAILLAISSINSSINDPSIKTYLDKLDLPKTLTISLVVLGLITFLAHGRDDA